MNSKWNSDKRYQQEFTTSATAKYQKKAVNKHEQQMEQQQISTRVYNKYNSKVSEKGI